MFTISFSAFLNALQVEFESPAHGNPEVDLLPVTTLALDHGWDRACKSLISIKVLQGRRRFRLRVWGSGRTIGLARCLLFGFSYNNVCSKLLWSYLMNKQDQCFDYRSWWEQWRGRQSWPWAVSCHSFWYAYYICAMSFLLLQYFPWIQYFLLHG